MQSEASWGEVFSDLGRFLTLRADEAVYDRIGWRHFVVGAVFTWLVGVARNWDFAEAPLFAKLGLPSLIYIIFMAALLWMSLYFPSSIKRHYLTFVTVVAMTAPPGLLYGIPVEMMFSDEVARTANLTFLGVVSVWRVLMFGRFAIVGCGVDWWTAVLGMLTPICAIIIGLTLTGRIVFVFSLMGGLRDEPAVPDAASNEFLNTLFCLSWPVLNMGLLIQVVSYSAQSRRGD